VRGYTTRLHSRRCYSILRLEHLERHFVSSCHHIASQLHTILTAHSRLHTPLPHWSSLRAPPYGCCTSSPPQRSRYRTRLRQRPITQETASRHPSPPPCLLHTHPPPSPRPPPNQPPYPRSTAASSPSLRRRLRPPRLQCCQTPAPVPALERVQAGAARSGGSSRAARRRRRVRSRLRYSRGRAARRVWRG
jgi:hypothetical protein